MNDRERFAQERGVWSAEGRARHREAVDRHVHCPVPGCRRSMRLCNLGRHIRIKHPGWEGGVHDAA